MNLRRCVQSQTAPGEGELYNVLGESTNWSNVDVSEFYKPLQVKKRVVSLCEVESGRLLVKMVPNILTSNNMVLAVKMQDGCSSTS